jgi:hypothetical protein
MRIPNLRMVRTILTLVLLAGSLSACCNPFWYGACGPGPGYNHGGGGHGGGGHGGYGGGGGGRGGWR